MKKFIMKYSEYLLLIGLFIINSILVGLFNFNIIITNIIYILLWIVIKYIIYLPFDKLLKQSYQNCDFNSYITEIEPLIEQISTKTAKTDYQIPLIVFQNILNPTTSSIEKYFNIIKEKNTLTKEQQLAYYTEILLICYLLDKKEYVLKLKNLIKEINTYNNSKVIELRLKRIELINNLFNNELNNLEENIDKYYLKLNNSNNLYQTIKTKFLLSIYYLKTNQLKKAKKEFTYIIKNGKDIFLVTKTKEYLKKIEEKDTKKQ